MAQNLRVSVLLRLNDQMSGGLRAALNTVSRECRGAGRSLADIANSANRVRPAGILRLNAAMREANSRARESVTSLNGLNQATNRIQPGGVSRLVAAMRAANNEGRGAAASLGGIASVANRIRPMGVERMTTALRAMQTSARASLATLGQISRMSMRGGMAVGAGVVAGGYIAKSAAERPMAYDRRLALLSNTANTELDATGRIAAKAKLNAGIRNAVNIGGGTPEQAAETLNTLVGSGAFGNANQAIALLPSLQKNATGTGASGQDLAQIMIAAKQTMGISEKDMPAMLSKAIKAGQLGGFELSDMAKWLPQQMALAGANGMKGMPGIEALLAANQVSRITSGTTDEAGNNLVNLLAKINSQDTVKDFKKQGIDLSGSLVKGVKGDVLPLEGFLKIVERVAMKDKSYVALRKQAEQQPGGGNKKTLSAMADIMEQGAIGRVVQDRQALLALLALLQQRDKYNEVKTKTAAETGKESETSYQTLASTLDFKTEQLGNKKAFAAIDTLDAINEPLGRLLDKTNELAEANPILTQRVYAGATALTVLAASAATAGLANTATAGSAGAFSASILAAGGALASLAVWASGVAAAGYAGYAFGTKVIHDNLSVSTNDKIGGYVNSFLEAFGSQQAAENTKKLNALAAVQRREKEWPSQINLHIDGHQVATVVNKQNTKQARRN